MKTFILLLIHFFSTLVKLAGSSGARTVIAESLMMKQQLIVLNRPRKRGPNLSNIERLLIGLWTMFIRPDRLVKAAVIFKPATILAIHKYFKNKKYSKLFRNKTAKNKPGRKGPSKELINAILDIKVKNPKFGYQKIADNLKNTFGEEVDKGVVRRVLAFHRKKLPFGPGEGPSWLTFLGHTKDSLWSVDMFRAESISLGSHWVMVVMDQFTRKIIGFAVNKGPLNAQDLSRMFYEILPDEQQPKKLSSDNDPLFLSLLWKINLEVWGIDEIKSVPHAPWSHPFVERLIKSIRNEYLDNIIFWNSVDQERKLKLYQEYFNNARVHSSLGGKTPSQFGEELVLTKADLSNFGYKSYCKEMFRIPVAA